MKRGSKAPYIPLVLAGCGFVLGWILQAVAGAAGDAPLARTLEALRRPLAAGSTVLLFGGIVFFAYMTGRRARTQEDKPADEPAKEPAAAPAPRPDDARGSMGFTLVYAVLCVLVFLGGLAALVNGFRGNPLVPVLWVTGGGALAAYYIRRLVRRVRRPKQPLPEPVARYPLVLEEKLLYGFDAQDPPVLRVLDDGTCYLIFEFFPPETSRFSEQEIENFADVLARHIGAPVLHDDRELFIIQSAEPSVIRRAAEFLEGAAEPAL